MRQEYQKKKLETIRVIAIQIAKNRQKCEKRKWLTLGRPYEKLKLNA